MNGEEKQPGQAGEVPSLEPVAEPSEQQQAEAGASEDAQEEAPAPEGAAVFDPKALPMMLWRIVKNPETGLADAHVPGRAGLFHGLVLGGVSVVVISISGLTEEKSLLISWVGGAAFLAIGAVVSFALRSTAGRAEQVDWNDDVFLMGGSLCYVLVAAILSLIIGLIPALAGVAGAVRVAGLLLGAFAYAEGLVDVGGVEDSRRIWITVAILAIASAASSALDFVPLV